MKGMRRNMVSMVLGFIILAYTTVLGQLRQELEKQDQPVTASEVLVNTIADIYNHKMPIQVYPPGYFDWLYDKGDMPMAELNKVNKMTPKTSVSASPPVLRSLRSQTDTSSMQLRTFNPATQKYQIIELDPFGGTSGAALGINNKGQVVGFIRTNSGPNRAVLWSHGQVFNLGTLGGDMSEAYGINDKGQVVGIARTSAWDNRAFLWFTNSMQNLGTLGGSSSEAYGINDHGQIIGMAQLNNGQGRAFLWSNGSMQNLGTLGGNSSGAYGINNSGHVVGSAVTSSGFQHAFLWSNNSMQDLGTIGSGEYSAARGISDTGYIVGSSQTNNVGWNDEHAFLMLGDIMQYIGTGFYGMGYGVNDSGQAVGFNLISGINETAFLWSNGSLYNLNDLVDTNLSPQFIVDGAIAINDHGQIAGYGRNSSGQTRALLLNPLPEGWNQTITNQPIKLVYGNLPVKQAGKNNLIVVTHGRKPDLTWLRAMTNSITQYLTNNNLSSWQVAGYEWSEDAEFFNPDSVLENGKQHGYKLGKHIAASGWTHVHFIAHSAGAGLINTASEVLYTNQVFITVHDTFLDPFVGLNGAGKEEYGRYSDWADNYFSSGDLFFTESILHYAYNVDVTQLNKVAVMNAFVSSGNNVGQPCFKSVSDHGWPYNFYQNTITGNVTPQYLGFGFLRGKEAGGWNSSLVNYASGSTNLGTPDDSCVVYTQPIMGITFKLNIDTIPTYQKGSVQKYPNGLKATTQSPSWVSMAVNLTNPVNFLSFDMKFASTNSQAQGLLSVYWDTNVVGSVDEQAVLPGFRRYTYALPNEAANTTHMLGFRLDPFTNIQSVAIVTNIVLGVSGPSEPFKLSTTTNVVGNLKVLELTGPTNFNYTVEMSTNLVNWQAIAWLVNTNGSVRFYDQSATNHGQQRFYRAVVPNSSL